MSLVRDRSHIFIEFIVGVKSYMEVSSETSYNENDNCHYFSQSGQSRLDHPGPYSCGNWPCYSLPKQPMPGGSNGSGGWGSAAAGGGGGGGGMGVGPGGGSTAAGGGRVEGVLAEAALLLVAEEGRGGGGPWRGQRGCSGGGIIYFTLKLTTIPKDCFSRPTWGCSNFILPYITPCTCISNCNVHRCMHLYQQDRTYTMGT